MALNEEIYGKIQDYLAGGLSEQERIAFEQMMNADEALAQEVALHADMEELLADSMENKLRASLQLLSNQVQEEPLGSGRSLSIKWLWLLIPVVLFAGWWLLKSPLQDQPSSGNIPRKIIMDSQEEARDESTEETEIEEAIPKTEGLEEQQQQEPSLPSKTEKPSSPNRVIAANFEPNPSLEFLMDNNLRSDDYEWTETQLQKNVTKTASEAFTFRFSGNLKTTADLSKQQFKLHIFSNKPEAFEEFSPSATHDLILQSTATDTYQIDFQKQMMLSPGLYYYLIEDFSEEQIYFVGKFEVR